MCTAKDARLLKIRRNRYLRSSELISPELIQRRVNKLPLNMSSISVFKSLFIHKILVHQKKSGKNPKNLKKPKKSEKLKKSKKPQKFLKNPKKHEKSEKIQKIQEVF